MHFFHVELSDGGYRISAHFTDPEYIEPRMTQSAHDGIIQRRRPMEKAELISTHAVVSQNPLPGIVTGDCKCGRIVVVVCCLFRPKYLHCLYIQFVVLERSILKYRLLSFRTSLHLTISFQIFLTVYVIYTDKFY